MCKDKLSRDLDDVEWKESAAGWIIIDDYRHVLLAVTAETWRHQDKEQSLMSNWSSASSSLLNTKLQVENVSALRTTNFVRHKWETIGNSKTSSACTAEKERERGEERKREKKGCDKIIKQVAACATLLLPLLQLLFLPSFCSPASLPSSPFSSSSAFSSSASLSSSSPCPNNNSDNDNAEASNEKANASRVKRKTRGETFPLPLSLCP